MQFDDVTDYLPLHFFEEMKSFILKNGTRQTFRNFDNNNPHYSFGAFVVYLGADIGQGNINNDPTISDFNQLSINSNHFIQHCLIIAVRKGDLKKNKCWVYPGMSEEKVYLINPYKKDIAVLQENCKQYIQIIKEKISEFNNK